MVNIVGIAGGSCSGKTSFARQIVDRLGDQCAILFQDNYYIDQSSKFDHDGGNVNFDHPEALDFNLLGEHLEKLKQDVAIQVPLYDFATHSRKKETLKFEPKPLVLVDGTLILTQPHLVKIMTASIFIQCPTDLRFQRRLTRDVEERGRTPDGVKDQFDAHVEPMHQKFVEPSQANASVVLTQEQYLNDSEAYIARYIEPIVSS